jgi:hypothetical protein
MLVYDLYLCILDIYMKLILNPKRSDTGADTYLSLSLKLDDSESLPPNRKLYAKYKLRIRSQINSNHLEETGLFSLFLQKNCYKLPVLFDMNIIKCS